MKKSGALWVACCPFHEEKTPSFKVDPRRGSWHCYGACSTGGDQIQFVMNFDNVGFLDAVEILAARTGVQLPERGKSRERARREKDEEEPLYAVLQRAERFYRRALTSPDGLRAASYLSDRGLGPDVCAKFGVGYAPAGGRVLFDEATRAGVAPELLEAVGLSRRTDSGRPYDFFRGRLMIPIRDERGRAVGFGARRLADDDESGPKYVNTPETRLFHKGTLIYGLDLSLQEVRRAGHLILVEGYTDVMAANQAGVSTVGAVLGTSTTENHATLVRRAGARRVSLVFDGDDAGKKAAFRALHGLLPLEIEIDLLTLPAGSDPCDMLTRRDGDDFTPGRTAFESFLAGATPWFEYLLAELDGKTGAQLSNAVDGIFDLLGRLQKPVHREARLAELGAFLNMPVSGLKEQWRALPSRRSAEARERRAREVLANAPEPSAMEEPVKPADPRDIQAFMGLLGAVLLDASLIPLLRPHRDRCPDPTLSTIFDAILELDRREEEIDADAVMTALLDDPARQRVVPIVEHASRAEDPTSLFEGEVAYLERSLLDREREDLCAKISKLERLAETSDPESAERARREQERLMKRMVELGRAPSETVRDPRDQGLSPQLS